MRALDVLRKKRDSLSRLHSDNNSKYLKLEKSVENFMIEVDNIIDFIERELDSYDEVNVVPKVILQREIRKSYFAEVIYEGQFCEMVLIIVDEDFNHKFLIYTTSISCL